MLTTLSEFVSRFFHLNVDFLASFDSFASSSETSHTFNLSSTEMFLYLVFKLVFVKFQSPGMKICTLAGFFFSSFAQD